VKDVQCGKGLFASIQFKNNETIWAINRYILDHGVLTRPEVNFRLKIMPPLCITEEELRFALKVIRDALDEFAKKGKEGVTGKA